MICGGQFFNPRRPAGRVSIPVIAVFRYRSIKGCRPPFEPVNALVDVIDTMGWSDTRASLQGYCNEVQAIAAGLATRANPSTGGNCRPKCRSAAGKSTSAVATRSR